MDREAGNLGEKRNLLVVPLLLHGYGEVDDATGEPRPAPWPPADPAADARLLKLLGALIYVDLRTPQKRHDNFQQVVRRVDAEAREQREQRQARRLTRGPTLGL